MTHTKIYKRTDKRIPWERFIILESDATVYLYVQSIQFPSYKTWIKASELIEDKETIRNDKLNSILKND